MVTQQRGWAVEQRRGRAVFAATGAAAASAASASTGFVSEACALRLRVVAAGLGGSLLLRLSASSLSPFFPGGMFGVAGGQIFKGPNP